MDLHSEQLGDTLVIRVNANRVDAAAAIQFKDGMRELTRQGPDRCVLDMEQVDFVDSSGLGAIVASLKQLDDGQKLDLAGLKPAVDKVFRLTRMDTIFAIYTDMGSAMTCDAR